MTLWHDALWLRRFDKRHLTQPSNRLECPIHPIFPYFLISLTPSAPFQLFFSFCSNCCFVFEDIADLGPWIRGWCDEIGTPCSLPRRLLGRAVESSRLSSGLRLSSTGSANNNKRIIAQFQMRFTTQTYHATVDFGTLFWAAKNDMVNLWGHQTIKVKLLNDSRMSSKVHAVPSQKCFTSITTRPTGIPAP